MYLRVIFKSTAVVFFSDSTLLRFRCFVYSPYNSSFFLHLIIPVCNKLIYHNYFLNDLLTRVAQGD